MLTRILAGILLNSVVAIAGTDIRKLFTLFFMRISNFLRIQMLLKLVGFELKIHFQL